MADYGLGTPAGPAGTAAGRTGSGKSRDDHGLVEVQWGREKLRVPLPPPASPLSALRATLYNLTGVPPSHQKLIYSGAVLKDDLAPLSAYGLVDEDPSPAAADSDDQPSGGGAKKSFWDSWSFTGRAGRAGGASAKKLKKLVMLGSKDVSARVDDRLAQRKDLQDLAAPDAAAAAGGQGAGGAGAGAAQSKEAETEEALRARIREIAGSKLDELEPQVKQVEAWLEQARAAEGGEGGAERPAPPQRTLLFLSEVLLQGLLKLDAIEIPGGYADARKERKEAVKRVQGVLDRVDAAKEGWKKLGLSLKA
ncbi:BAG family molecular chaperone regulator [Rhodotorula paludigena]|uniref:BAG family molecular chaperone regulator n=1 Tax=Rhodotorula paludigena TaxID=86838 RepID=UPI003174D5AB